MTRRQRLGILGLFLLLSLMLLSAFMPDAPAKSYYENLSWPLVIAHQGGDGIITDRPDLMIQALKEMGIW